ncbi:hypothetical protein D8X55_01055 [Malacoplasma penetrans]|uniref:UPF0122 protein MYPE4850 n=1 Tax=Malacoplasma penetrans (strain HF-2) TaxID=272633 RepID=Y485_MALP2|nr:hypothetical protein [Malacoplasma penetrans]Q8EVS4.1 RecName: Full=UPF0122 protein MYPE4850 [Malacoplasma penetrans HF-2]RXY97272.1 hypothetical protein D8X55_01055 [Malacoplasma penetrans]BAC44275.1 conserved hypothetical protein [Malacoplasma penetrans HF-2]
MKELDLSQISLLIDFYGNLLTDKQLQNLIDYYFNDLSLSEIAANNNVSRTAIHDSIKKSKNELEQFENKLKFIYRFNLRKEIYKQIKDNNLLDQLLETEVEQLWKTK